MLVKVWIVLVPSGVPKAAKTRSRSRIRLLLQHDKEGTRGSFEIGSLWKCPAWLKALIFVVLGIGLATPDSPVPFNTESYPGLEYK